MGDAITHYMFPCKALVPWSISSMLQDLLLLCGTANPHRSPGGALGNSCACKGLSCSFSRVVQRDMGLWGFRAPKKAAKWATKNSPFRSLPRAPPPPRVLSPRPPHVPGTLLVSMRCYTRCTRCARFPHAVVFCVSSCFRAFQSLVSDAPPPSPAPSFMCFCLVFRVLCVLYFPAVITLSLLCLQFFRLSCVYYSFCLIFF